MSSLGGGRTVHWRHGSDRARNVPDARAPPLERIRQLDLCLKDLDAPGRFGEREIPCELCRLVSLFAQPPQPEPLRPCHLLREQSSGVVSSLNLHLASPS